MGTPFLGEIKITSFNYPPKGWAFCNGQLLPIQQYQGLFSLLGTAYGGDGIRTFALPNLQGRVPMHMDSSQPLGGMGGQETHTLTSLEMPSHAHGLQASADFATSTSPTGHVLAAKARGGANLYAAGNSPTPLSSVVVGDAGGSQAHENRQPYLALSFIIALQGIYPSQN